MAFQCQRIGRSKRFLALWLAAFTAAAFPVGLVVGNTCLSLAWPTSGQLQCREKADHYVNHRHLRQAQVEAGTRRSNKARSTLVTLLHTSSITAQSSGVPERMALQDATPVLARCTAIDMNESGKNLGTLYSLEFNLDFVRLG